MFGSAPEAALAAQYARGVGATHALFGGVEGGALRLHLARAGDAAIVLELATPIGEAELVHAEGGIATGVARALGASVTEEVAGRLGAPLTADPAAYRALLVGMDLEMTASVLRRDHAEEADARLREAVGSYLAAIRADAGLAAAEERVLYVAAELVERDASERAIEILEDLIVANPRAWRAHYLLGELRREAGLTSQAVVAFELSNSLQPLADADVVRLARLYVESDAPDSAAAKLRRVKVGSPAYGEAQAELGALLLAKGDAAGAVGALERAREAGERGGPTLARLGQAYARAGDTTKARATFEEALRVEDAGWLVPASYAAYLHGEGDLTHATELYRKASDRGAPPTTRLNHARALIVIDRHGAALEELRTVLAASPDAETAAQARRLLFGLERPEDEHRLEEAGQVAVGAREGDVEEARETLTRITASAPDLWEAHFGLGLTARRAGDAAAAEAAFRRALEILPDQPDAEHELGVALLMLGKIDEAVLSLEEASHHRPDDPGFLADVGFGYMVSGNLYVARSRLERARALDPEDEITRQYLEELEKREAETPSRNS